MQKLALPQCIAFRGALARAIRPADDHFSASPPQFAPVVIETRALEQLDQEGAAGFQVAVGEIHRQLGQMHHARLVDRIHTTLIGGHIRQHKVHLLPAQHRLQLR